MCRIGYMMKDGKCQKLEGNNINTLTDFAYSEKNISTLKS